MQIQTKFNVGDPVWLIRRSAIFGDCVDCAGVGKQTILETGKKQTCVTCHGNKKSNVGFHWRLGQKDHKQTFIVSHLQIDINSHAEPKIVYSLDYFDEPDELEEDLFTTKELAQEECDRRNNAKVQS